MELISPRQIKFLALHMNECLDKNFFYHTPGTEELDLIGFLNIIDLCIKERLKPSAISETIVSYSGYDKFLDKLLDHLKIYQFNDDENGGGTTQRNEIYRTSLQIELITKILSPSDHRFFNLLKQVMDETQVNIDSISIFELLEMCRPLLYLGRGHFCGYVDVDWEKFWELSFIQTIVRRIEQIHFENLQDLLAYVKDLFSRSDLDLSNFFDENLLTVLLVKPIRDNLLRLTDPNKISIQDYPVLCELLENYFHRSHRKTEIIKALIKAYVKSPEIPIKDKIEFFVKEYDSAGYEVAVAIAEQITDLETYRRFRDELDKLANEHTSGERSLNQVVLADVLSSQLQDPVWIVKTASTDIPTAKEVSTQLADVWADVWLHSLNNRVLLCRYDKERRKFILGERFVSSFATVRDIIENLRNLHPHKKFAIVLKAMTDQNGLLVSEENKQLVQKTVLDVLGLSDPFFQAVIKNAIQSSDIEIVALPVEQVLSGFLSK